MPTGVLIDISGVLYVGDEIIDGTLDAMRILKRSNLPTRFVTNTTRSPAREILSKLLGMGFDIEVRDLYTAPMAARDYVDQHGLSPYLLIHPALREELDYPDVEQPDAVLVGDAGEDFSYVHMNEAFRVLLSGAPLIAMGKNRYFQEADGLSIDAGAFLTALEYAADTEAIILGKPSPDFFLAAVKDMGCGPADVVMIGDDVESDVNGAVRAGLSGILVQTGKYRPGDEQQLLPDRTVCVADFSEAVKRIV